MKAIQFDRYGSPAVLICRDIGKPRCRPAELLVRVHAAGVNPKDCLVRKGKFRWFTGRRFPKGLGHDFAGTVEAVGRPGGPFQVGDEVYGMTNGWQGRTYAEWVAVSVTETAPKPAGLGFAEAAAVPLAGQTALQALRDIGRLRPGQRVLINGASGGVGTFAVQIARILGAHVTAVCSGRNRDMVGGLGAHRVIDYTREDLGRWSEPVDLFFDVFGNHRYPDVRPMLSPRGRYIATVPNLPIVAWGLLSRLTVGPQAHLVVVKSRTRDLQTLTSWIEARRLAPMLDRTYPLEAVEQAHSHVETKRARGKVVLEVT